MSHLCSLQVCKLTGMIRYKISDFSYVCASWNTLGVILNSPVILLSACWLWDCFSSAVTQTSAQKGKFGLCKERNHLDPYSCESMSSSSSTVAKSMVPVATVKRSLEIPHQLFLPPNANKKVRYDCNREWRSLLVGLWSILLIQSEISDEKHQGNGKFLTWRKIKRIKNLP